MPTPKPGDHVVHAVHGPGEVIAVEPRDTPDGPVDYVTIRIDDMRVLVPLAELDEVGVRAPMTREEAQDVLDLLGEEPLKDPGHAGRRRRNSSRLVGGDAEALAKVIRSLAALREASDKPLRYRDKEHLRAATDKLVDELAIALQVSPEEARDLIADAVDASE